MTPQFHCFGELLLRLSAPGYERLLQSHRLDVFFGGAEANVAAALSAFGKSAAMVSALPDNPLGAAALNALRAQGIDTRHIVKVPGRMGLYFHTQGAMRRPSEVIYDREYSAFALADPATFDWRAILKGARWLHVSGITAAVSERAGSSALHAVQVARELGVLVSFDCNYRARVWGARATQAPRVLNELCAHADLLFADDRDLTLIFEKPSDATAAFERYPRLQWLARTRRAAHSVDQQEYSGELIARDRKVVSRPHALTNIVERIGAGDAFAAGLLYCLDKDKTDVQRAIEFGTAAASYKHSLSGDACIASVAEIESSMNESGPDIKR